MQASFSWPGIEQLIARVNIFDFWTVKTAPARLLTLPLNTGEWQSIRQYLLLLYNCVSHIVLM